MSYFSEADILMRNEEVMMLFEKLVIKALTILIKNMLGIAPRSVETVEECHEFLHDAKNYIDRKN